MTWGGEGNYGVTGAIGLLAAIVAGGWWGPVAAGLVVYAVLCAATAQWAGEIRGVSTWAALWLGLLLGPLGVIAVLLWPAGRKTR